jgi:hypothetical protein
MAEPRAVDIGEWLFRRGYSTPQKKYVNPDGTATSRVFKLREKDNGELSVDIKSLTTANVSVGDSSKYFLFELSNSDVIKIGLNTYHAEEIDGSNEAHAVIVGMSMEDEIMPGLLAKCSRQVIF